MSNIGIVGAGIAGVQLALYLQQNGIAVTIYSDKTPDAILNSRLPNTPARFPHTIERERQLNVAHWDTTEFKLRYIEMYIVGEHPLAFRGDLTEPGSFVDPRLYCATLLSDFQDRGGKVVIGTLTKANVSGLAEEHDLMVVASGRGSLIEMFERIPEYSPYSQPQRNLVAGYFNGIKRDPNGMNFVIAPGQGEIFQGCLYTAEGLRSNLLLEGIPGQEFDVLTRLRYEDNPAQFNATVIELLQRHAPPVYANIDPETFGAVRAQDLIQGAITPTVRRAYADLGNKKFALAIGDVHIVNDPIIGQGANTASHSAWTVGEAILTHHSFDEEFCKQVEQDLLSYALSVTNWSNAFLQPPPPHVIGLLVNAALQKSLATAFVDGFNTPDMTWAMLSNPMNTEAFIQDHMPIGAN